MELLLRCVSVWPGVAHTAVRGPSSGPPSLLSVLGWVGTTRSAASRYVLLLFTAGEMAGGAYICSVAFRLLPSPSLEVCFWSLEPALEPGSVVL